MKTFLLDLSLSASHFFSSSKCWSSRNFSLSEETFSCGVCHLSVNQSLFSKFLIFHELWKIVFLFCFASLLPAPTHFEKSWFLSENSYQVFLFSSTLKLKQLFCFPQHEDDKPQSPHKSWNCNYQPTCVI